MAIEAAAAYSGLRASGVPSGVNVSGVPVIGVASTTTEFSDADIGYSFTVTADAVSDKATLNLATGAITQTTGTPEVTRRGTETDNLAAEDFEGATLATAVRIYAVHASTPATNTGSFVAASGSNTPYVQTLYPGAIGLSTNEQTSPGTLDLTFYAAGDEITVTVIGKSS